MYIQLKKAVIIFVFLLSIIIMLVLQNYNLKEDSYNMLVISDETDITSEGITKNVWEDISNLYSTSEVLKQSKSINYKYLEIKNEENFQSTLSDSIAANDLVIIIGDTYNKKLNEMVLKYQDTNFLLIENSLDLNNDNVYRINIKWEDIYRTIKNFLQEEITRLRDEKKINKGEVLNLWCIVDGNDFRYNELKERLTGMDVELKYININEINAEEFTKIYNQNEEFYILNLNFDNQIEVIKQLVKFQKQNVYDYYKAVTTKEPVEYSVDDKENTTKDDTKVNKTTESSDDNESDKTEKSDKESRDLKYIPMHYLGVYEGDISIGEYDNMLEGGNIVSENIIEDEFKLNYETYLDKIIFAANAKHDYNLNLKDETMKIESVD